MRSQVSAATLCFPFRSRRIKAPPAHAAHLITSSAVGGRQRRVRVPIVLVSMSLGGLELIPNINDRLCGKTAKRRRGVAMA